MRASFLPFAPFSARLLAATAIVVSTTSHAGFTACNASGSSGPSCTAPSLNAGTGSVDSTQAFAGVNWTFGVGPDLVVGVRHTRTNSRQRVEGVRLEAVFPFNTAFSSISFDRLRLRLIGGHRDGMYEVGGGYSFSAGGFLASAALQTNHLSLGTDLIVGGMQWLPYVGFDTLTKPKRAGNGNVCPSGFTLTSVSSVPGGVNPADQSNGQTCFKGLTLPSVT